MFLLPRLAGDVDSKGSRMKGLFISRTKRCFEGRRKVEYVVSC